MPRDRVVTTTVYKFDELSEDAQEKAIENWSNLRSENFDNFDQESIARDPRAIFGPYKGADDFHAKTEGAYRLPSVA